MNSKAKRVVKWLAVPLDATYTTFQFDSEDACREWIAQPICSAHYRARAVVMAQCKCCGLFHIHKPFESISGVSRLEQEGKEVQP